MGGSAEYWKGRVVWKMPEWVEPVAIVGILLTAMFITRRRDVSLFGGSQSSGGYRPLLSPENSPRESVDSEDGFSPRSPRSKSPTTPKRRRIFGLWTVTTPNSSRFAKHYHSRILLKFPFLVEMFYWVITYFFYRMTAYLSAVWYGSTESLWMVAQDHGIALLETEAWFRGATSTGTNRWVEWNIQQWFLTSVEVGDARRFALTFLNRAYALIHIPGTVGFIAYYYTVAPNFTRFSTVRRTMSLLNLFAFFTFTVYPCMPPRLLPEEYGFIDTVNAENAASVFMGGKYVNKLAAMPSMHFGYAFCIGCVFVYESGFLREWCRIGGGKSSSSKVLAMRDDEESDVEGSSELNQPHYLKQQQQEQRAEEVEAGSDSPDAQRSPVARILFLVVGILYPSLILLCIVATANHYILDAIAAAFVVLISFLCNRVLLNFLVLEDWLLWAWRLEKPEPTTGQWARRR